MNTLNPYDLSRYVTAQQRDYQSALTEIKNGKNKPLDVVHKYFEGKRGFKTLKIIENIEK